jgi:hypothetical protein
VQATVLKTVGVAQCLDYGATACIARQQSDMRSQIRIEPVTAAMTRISCVFETFAE